MRQRAADAGYPELIDYLGPLPRDQLAEHLAAAHVFAGPSRYEGGPGMVYLEAMACGLPVIACAGSGASEVVQAGMTGLLVTPEDVVDLTNKLETLMKILNDRSQWEEQPERMSRSTPTSENAYAKSRSSIFRLSRTLRWMRGFQGDGGCDLLPRGWAPWTSQLLAPL